MEFKNNLTIEVLKQEFEHSQLALAVIEELESQGDDWKKHLSDITTYGCASGVVSSLIYIGDTIEFHDENEHEIDELLHDLLTGTDTTFSQLVNGTCDLYDIDAVKNFKSWFSFEEKANEISSFLEQL